MYELHKDYYSGRRNFFAIMLRHPQLVKDVIKIKKSYVFDYISKSVQEERKIW